MGPVSEQLHESKHAFMCPLSLSHKYFFMSFVVRSISMSPSLFINAALRFLFLFFPAFRYKQIPLLFMLDVSHSVIKIK